MSHHPIYVDVPMLLSLAASLRPSPLAPMTEPQDGGDATASIFDLYALLADVTGRASGANRSNCAESAFVEPQAVRQRTEALLAMRLYERLQTEPDRLTRPTDMRSWQSVPSQALIEVSGTLSRGYLDRLLDYLEAVCLAQELMDIAAEQDLAWTSAGEAAFTRRKRAGRSTPPERFRDMLAGELRRAPIVNLLLSAPEPASMTLVLALRSECLVRNALSDVQQRSAQVVGKVARIVPARQEFSLTASLGAGLIRPGFLEDLLKQHAAHTGVAFDPGQPTLPGPAVIVLPLMLLM